MIQLHEAIENRKNHIMAVKAILKASSSLSFSFIKWHDRTQANTVLYINSTGEMVGKVEFDHHAISRHTLLKPASRMDSRLTTTRDTNSNLMMMKV